MQRDPRAYLWDVLQNALPPLLATVVALMDEMGSA